MENQDKNNPIANTVFTPGQVVTGSSYPAAQQSPVTQSSFSAPAATSGYEAPILPEENSLETLPPTTNNPEPTTTISTPNPAQLATLPKKPLLNKAFIAIGVTAVVIVLGVAGLAAILTKKNTSQLQSPAESVNEQGITLGSATPDVLSVLQLKGSEDKLIVNGDVITTGRLSLASGNFYGQFVTNNLSANREYVLPDSSGTLCLDTNNCNFVGSIGGAGGAITLGVGLSIQGNTIVNSQTPTTVNGFNGNVVVQGTTNQINVANNAGTIVLSAPQDIATSSSPTFQSLTLVATGTQGGNVLCDISNNCGYAGGTNAFVQNGNSFGATAVLGTNDNNNLVFETNNISRVTLDTTGNVGISAVSNGAKLYVPYQTGDVGGTAAGALYSGTATLVQVGDSTNINNNLIAIDGESYSGVGVQGISTTGSGVVGISSGASSAGVTGFNNVAGGTGVTGLGGVFGIGDGVGVFGSSGTNYGVWGQSANGVSGFFQSTCTGLFVCTGSSAQPTLVAAQYTNSTADLFQAQDSSGNARFRIAYDGHTGIGNGNNAAVDDCTLLSALLSGPTCYSVLNIQENITDLTKGYTSGINNHILLSAADGANISSSIQGINNAVATAVSTANYSTVRGELTNLYHQGSGTITFGEAAHFTVNNASSGSIVFAKGLQADAANTSNGNISFATGLGANAANTAGGTIGTATGLSAAAVNLGSGSITTTYGIDVNTGASGVGSSITTNYGMRIQSAYNVGTITTNYGAHIMTQTAGASDYGLRVDAADTQTLWLSGDADNTTAAAGIAFGASRDTNLYRSAANTLKTDQDMVVGSQLAVGSVASITASTVATFGETYTAASGNLYGTNTTITLNPAGASSAVATASSSNLAISAQNHTGFLTGAGSSVTNNGSGTLTYAFGSTGGALNTSNGNITIGYGTSGAVVNSGAGNITFLGAGVVGQIQNTGSGNIAAAAALFASGAINSGAGSITSNTGLFVQAQTAGVSDYGIQVEAADTQTLWLSSNADNTTANAGIAFGSSRDTNLYRSAANTLKTDDNLVTGGNLTVEGIGASTIAGSLDVAGHVAIGALADIDACNVTTCVAPSFVNHTAETLTGTTLTYNAGTFTEVNVNSAADSNTLFFGNATYVRTQDGNAANYNQFIVGHYGSVEILGSGLVANTMGAYSKVTGDASANITNAFGLYIDTNSIAGTVASNYGIKVNAQTAGTSDYGIAIDAADTQTLWLSSNANNTTASAGIAFGSSRDTNLYRSAADTLRTDDALSVGASVDINGDLTFAKEATRTIKVADTTTAATAGGALSLVGGAGSAVTSGAGGAANLTGGSAQAGNSNGGAVNITGGISAGVAVGGGVNIAGGAGLTGGNVTINAGSGVADGNIRLATTDGMVAIGSTTTPTAMLHVRGRLATTTTFIADNLAIVGAIAEFKDNGTNVMQLADGGAALFQNATDSTTGFKVMDADGGTSILNVDTTNERVGIGKDAPTVSLDVLSAGADGTTVAQFMNAGATSCTVQPGGTGFACASDARLKTNVATVINPLDTIKQLRGVTFNWTSSPDGQGQVGFIAQELEQLIPSAVSNAPNGYKVANYTAIIPYLVGAAQAQDLQISGLVEDTIALQQSQSNNLGAVSSLTNRVNTLEQKVAALEVASQVQGNNFASLNVSGPATIQTLSVSGTASVTQLSVTGDAIFAGDIMIQGHILGNVDTRGSVTIPAGQAEYKFTFVKPYTVGSLPNVVLTPKSAFAPSYRVESTDKGFTVYFLTPVASDVIMNYQVQE